MNISKSMLVALDHIKKCGQITAFGYVPGSGPYIVHQNANTIRALIRRGLLEECGSVPIRIVGELLDEMAPLYRISENGERAIIQRQEEIITQPITSNTICQVVLPLPPGINASYKTGKGRFYGSAELEAFKLQSRVSLNRQREKIDWQLVRNIQESKKKTPLGMEIFFFYPTLWLHDVDGGVKAVQDSICKYLEINDNQIVDLHVHKHANRDNPCVEVKMWIIEEWK